MRLMPHHLWQRLLLAAVLLLAQLGAPAHALTMRMGTSDSVAALLADPSAYCHSADQTTAPGQPGPAQAPMSHGDCVACGVCQLAGAVPLLSAGVTLPAPIRVVSVRVAPAHQDGVVPAAASSTPPARAPPTAI